MAGWAENNSIDRKAVLLGAVLAELCIGMLNANSAFTAKLCDKAGRYAWTLPQADWISSLALAVFVVFVVLSEWIRDRFGAGTTMFIGGLTMGAGYLLAAFFGSTWAAQLTGIGIVSGAGAGMAFLVPFLTVLRWFPDRKGLALGLTASGFVFGTVFWSWAAELGCSFNIGGMGGVQSTYLFFGTILILAFTGVNMPFRHAHAGFYPLASRAKSYLSAERTMETPEFLKSRTFYLTAAAFFLSAFAGFLIIEYLRPYGTHLLTAKGLEIKLAAKVAELSVFVARALLAAGCVCWGIFYDQGGRRRAVLLMCALQGSAVLLYPQVAGSPQTLVLFSSLAGFIAGGNYVLFILFAGDRFGDENIGTAYALLFPALGIAALAAPGIAFHMTGAASGGSETFARALPFYMAGAASILAAALMAFNRPDAESRD